ncbi:MAG: LLM class F420-dependent oxidoreductase [Actinobacteria bacterium]|nr:MAG: LLM class F420-dependent oxidoreductase [Actinomycetota bacterium]
MSASTPSPTASATGWPTSGPRTGPCSPPPASRRSCEAFERSRLVTDATNGRRWGLTIPFDNVPLHEQKQWISDVVAAGYTDLWSSEAGGTDGFTPLALASQWAPSARLGVAIIPAFTRGPGLMAMSVAAMAETAPGRFAFGVGTSSDVIVQRWNGIPFDEPYKRTRDMVRFLRKALTGDKVDEQYDTFTVKGFRLGRPPEVQPPILVGALRPGMLRLAGREGDGAIINWLSADDVKQVVPHVGEGKEVVARIFVCPSEDADAVRNLGRYAISAYLNVPVYKAFHEWLGRGDDLGGMWEGKAAVAAIPDRVVDDLVVHGSPAECRAHVQRYVDNGVTTPALAIFPLGDARQAALDLAPH